MLSTRCPYCPRPLLLTSKVVRRMDGAILVVLVLPELQARIHRKCGLVR